MISTITYQQLHTQSLLTCNFTRISQNFRTLDKFIKDFSIFQRKLSDLEKSQKATAQDLANFKLSTQNTFNTLNDVVESRNDLSTGKSMADAQQIQQIKKSFTELKKFITQNTRDQHQAQTIRDEEQVEYQAQISKKFQNATKQIEKNQAKGKAIQTQLRELRLKLATKNQVEKVRSEMVESQKNITNNEQQINNISQLLTNLNVQGFKSTIDKMQMNLENQLADMKKKLRLKSDISDTIKLQQMMLNLVHYTFDHLSKKSADKIQTKKALVFLEKRINKIVQLVFPQQQGEHEAILATKGWKCVSCAKDLGDYQGKLDKYKPWSIFPAKQSPVKDRYSGFGAGFQSVMQSTAAKKGMQVTFDEKGRMTTPFNLTRQVQTNLLKPSYSNSKLKQSTGFTKSRGSLLSNRQQLKPLQMQTNFMNLYGRNSQVQIDIKDQYTKRYRGLLAFVKTAYQQNKHDTE